MKAWLFFVLLLIVFSCEAGKKKKKKPSSGGFNLKDLFLRRPVQTAKPATPSPTPAPVNKEPADFGIIKSTEEFYKKFKVPRLPQHRNDTKRPGSDHSTSVGSVDTSVLCQLGEELVHLPTPKYGEGYIFPPCAWVKRCIGCCINLGLSDLVACQPMGVQQKTVEYYHFYIPPDGPPVFQNKFILLEEHTGCGCGCLRSADSCNPETQSWNADHCKCQCKQDPPAFCPVNFQYSPTECGCVCKTGPKECPYKMEWSNDDCNCRCTDPLGSNCPSKSRDPYTCECVQARLS